MYKFLKEETLKDLRTQFTFVGKKCELFIPSYFLEKNENLADIRGNLIESLGLFWFRVDDDELYELQLPIKMLFGFTERSSKKLVLKPGMPEMKYDIFTLYNGDPFIYDINHKKDISDIQFFINKLVEGAKMPPTVSYNDSLDIFFKALIASGLNAGLGVPSLILEFLLSEAYRYKRNMSTPLRMEYKGRDFDYKMVRMTRIPMLNSQFTSLISEDISQQLVSSITKTRTRQKDRESPIEKLIRY